jgi:hypothetical protein
MLQARPDKEAALCRMANVPRRFAALRRRAPLSSVVKFGDLLLRRRILRIIVRAVTVPNFRVRFWPRPVV